MELIDIKGVRLYRFSGLAAIPGLIHGVFTRQGGVSRRPYHSLNVSLDVGDLPRNVEENLHRVQRTLGLTRLVSASQVHGLKGAVITGGQTVSAGEIPGVDILITATPGVGLLIKQADCQAVMFYDPEHRVVAHAHCGWRGQVGGILAETVALLTLNFGSRAEALRAAIGPGLGPCCAEFRNYRQEFPEKVWQYQVRPCYFDLWRLSFDQLRVAGIRSENIEVAKLCTRCREEEFFSYRRDRVTGRQAAVIALAP
uniref:Laccase domain-containing protein n=1 Tax=Desulfobacca acetoxidans TaxID=60893 RepID=A0A7V6A355_9BACT